MHWTLWAPHLYRINSDRLWDRATTVNVRGAHVATLSPEDTLLFLVIHRARTSLRLRLLCDIAELLRRYTATLDWDYVLNEAHTSGARTALYWSLSAAEQLLGAPVPLEIGSRLNISPGKRRVLEMMCGARTLFVQTKRQSEARQPTFAQRWLMFDTTRQVMRAVVYRAAKTGRYLLYNLKAQR
jgi:hypothetical protein